MYMYISNHYNYSTQDSFQNVREWMKSLFIYGLELTKCGSDTLNESHVSEIDKALSLVKVDVYSNQMFFNEVFLGVLSLGVLLLL